ncbi:MAG: aldehyde dehydrogenase [Candidatus Faecalibacterium intestinavium]|uniref:Aldehyde dehydrogenase n=1 Tax=Candidatus Faecalibacterium intestinavium TaxID=2838580 RepID=A0A9E2NRQ4_9FIRM|nr:aldehyde dehydrogenase [Candidatus Faecalibacterium intestinavium]
MNIESILRMQRQFFDSRQTFDIDTRLQGLRRLREAILAHEEEINAALKEDLGKSASESYMCETGMTLAELSDQIRHLRRRARPRRRMSNLANFPSSARAVFEPYGVVLVMSPWNYPFMLCMEPVIGAIAAGNCCVVKPSAYSPATSAVIRTILSEVFPPEYVAVVEGGRAENAALLEQRFDYIFFTGGVTVGRLVMEKAAVHLTPVTLELGGKSPCIVTADCDLKVAARRIVFGKFLNCGQTCVAPDYLLVDQSVKEPLLALIQKEIARQYGPDPLANPDYGKIINRKHFDRLCGLIDPAKVVCGGQTQPDALRIAPTLLDHVQPGDAIMQEEIFGPLLPVLTYKSLDQAVQFIQSREKPLALYLFTRNRKAERLFAEYVSFGGGCVNDTILHLSVPSLGFGGVGRSGMGSYHGRKSFETFSHEKSILKKPFWPDLPLRYQPYTNALYQKMIRIFLR